LGDLSDSINLQEFIFNGELTYLRSDEAVEYDPYNYIRVKKIKKYIDDILLGNTRDIIVERDSTFSALLHWSYLLKPKNLEVASKLNLSYSSE
jgi:hypothetical protein